MAATQELYATVARAIAPRPALKVSQWADENRILSQKTSPEHGKWKTHRNPVLREPMDCMSSRSRVQDVVCMFPIQLGKSEIACNAVGYTMDHNPCPIMVCLPGEISMHKWVAQKLNPLLDETPAVRNTLTTLDSRKSANQRFFKDYAGGQLFLEHAGSALRLKQTTVKVLIVDELDEFARQLTGGDDPIAMLEGRTSAYPSSYKRLFISTPTIQGLSRIAYLYEKSDQRKYYVPCPHCGHKQNLTWQGLSFQKGSPDVWYLCEDCGEKIEEHHKKDMLAAGEWIPTYPERKIRGYHVNALYYPIGLGPRWADLVAMWIEAQGDKARLKTFINDRLAEPWEDPAVRTVRFSELSDRAEPYPLRLAPDGVLAITAGTDTQDDRLETQIVGWGIGMRWWTLDYVVIEGDPDDGDVWVALTDLLNSPIQHSTTGFLMPVMATAIDAGGHRTEAVKDFVRKRMIWRPMATFGAKPNNAPVLSRGKLQDVTWDGKLDKRGVMIHHIGTVATKQKLYSWLSSDSDKAPDERHCHFSDELPSEYYAGLVSETFNPLKGRFEHKRGAPRNEPLDTWSNAFAAAHHSELRLNRYTEADWLRLRARMASGEAAPASPLELKAPASTKSRVGPARRVRGFR